MKCGGQSSSAVVTLEGRWEASEGRREGCVCDRAGGHGRTSRDPALQGLCPESLRSPGSVLLGLLPNPSQAGPSERSARAGRLPFEGGKASRLAVRHLLRAGGGCGGPRKVTTLLKITAVAARVRPEFPPFRELVSVFTSVRVTYNLTQNLFSDCKGYY